MIRTFAELISAFANEEASKLREYRLDHAPTIGAMYEGLSTELVNRAVPSGLDLQVVSGFVVDARGNMSGQIDCMLVRGTGEQIPYTEQRKWPVWDVLAVFEVKKSLYGADLRDAFAHLRSVHQSFWDWLHGDRPASPVNIARALNSFSRITGLHAPEFSKYEKVLSPEMALIYYTIVIEQLTPVRIILGYGGYKTEAGLRDGLVSFLKENKGAGFGILSFPHLITCNGSSLCKATGQPYTPPLRNGCWDFLVSSPTNPLWLMLELLWTKIENACGVQMPWEDDLVQEVFHPFIAARPVAGKGWEYLYGTGKELEAQPTIQEWHPAEITITQQVVLNRVVESGCVDSREREFVDFLQRSGVAVESFLTSLVATQFVAMDGPLIRPIVKTLHFVFTPDGRTYAGEHPGQITAFVAARAAKVAKE